MEDVLVLRDFPNVFLDEFLRLPLEQKLKFAINLVPGSHFISLPLVELKELKT